MFTCALFGRSFTNVGRYFMMKFGRYLTQKRANLLKLGGGFSAGAKINFIRSFLGIHIQHSSN